MGSWSPIVLIAAAPLMPPEDQAQTGNVVTAASAAGVGITDDDVFVGERRLVSSADKLSPASQMDTASLNGNGAMTTTEIGSMPTIAEEIRTDDGFTQVIAKQVVIVTSDDEHSENSSPLVRGGDNALLMDDVEGSHQTLNGGQFHELNGKPEVDVTRCLDVVKSSVDFFKDGNGDDDIFKVEVAKVVGATQLTTALSDDLVDLSFVSLSVNGVSDSASVRTDAETEEGKVAAIEKTVLLSEKCVVDVAPDLPINGLTDAQRLVLSPGTDGKCGLAADPFEMAAQTDSGREEPSRSTADERPSLVLDNATEFPVDLVTSQKLTNNNNNNEENDDGKFSIPLTPQDSLESVFPGGKKLDLVDCPAVVKPSDVVEAETAGSTEEGSLNSADDVFKEEEVDSKTDGDSGFYCQDCETAICSACTDIEHHSHLTTHLQDAVEEQKEVLQALLEKAEAQVPVLKEAIDLVADMEAVLASRSAEAEDQINTCFDSLRDVLEQRRHLLLAELDDTYSRKQQILSHQRELLDACLSDLSSSCEFTEKALNHGSDTEVLIVKKQMAERLSEFSAMQIQKMPEENDYLVYDESDFILVKKSLYNLGSVQSNSAVAFETTAAGEGLKQCIVGKQTVVTITTKDRNGDLVKVGHSLFKAEITSLTSPVSYITEVSDHKNGSYDLLYTVPREGQYQLSVRLFGQHIKGSPFRVKAYVEEESSSSDRPISKIPRTTGVRQHATKRTPSAKSGGSNRRSNPIEDDLILRVGNKGRNKGEFTNPQGICCTTTGRIMVADSNNQCLQSFTNSGECKLRFGIRGRSAGQLQRPTGVAVMPTGNYVVADYDNKWVSVFEPNGKFVNRIGVGKLLGPKGVAVDKNGHIIVVDNKASCVLIFQSNGKLISKFGSRGNQENQFAGPHFVAVNQKNQIVVSDFHNHCIKVFDSDGGFVMSFGSNGEGNGQFNAPTGVAVDAQDNILVADWGNSRIQVFDSNGSFLSYVNTMADPLYGPQGLALTESGHIVVADSGNHCYKVYKYLQ